MLGQWGSAVGPVNSGSEPARSNKSNIWMDSTDLVGGCGAMGRFKEKIIKLTYITNLPKIIVH